MELLPTLNHFVRLLPEPCFLLTGSGTVLSANDAVAELTGVSLEALHGSNIADRVSDPPEKMQRYLALCSRSRQLLPGSFIWLSRQGAPMGVRCDAGVMRPRTETEEAVLFLRCRPKAEATDHFVLLNQKLAALSKEVFERKKAEQQRDELLISERAARINAERNSRMKDEFLATLSHELRTPLNAILGWAQVLRSEESSLTPTAAEGVEVIERNARVQTRLIEDLLDMSRIISGKIRLDVQRVELPAVIAAAIEAVRPSAEAKGIRIQQTLDPIAGPIKGDPSRLQQVVWNLLSNSVKFTTRGGRIQIVLERVNSHLELSVSDTGEGIKPEFLPHVFDRFRQEDASTTRAHGGLGLGLSITKQLVELHGGSIRAKSPGPGQGATFIVNLPLMVLREDEDHRSEPRVHPGSEGPVSDYRRQADLSGVRVLIVDDEPDAQTLVRRLLEGCNAVTLTAGTVAEAIQLIKTAPPDVVISDLGMPVEDGYALIRRLRQFPPEAGGRIPAIALTAFARTEDRTRALLSGFQIHLSKPIEAPELIAAVASLTGRTG